MSDNKQQSNELAFDSCYPLGHVEHVITAIYQDYLIKKITTPQFKDNFLAPYVVFDGIDSFSFEGLMLFCKLKLHHSDKRYFPIIIKPGVGSAHYMAAIMRKDLDREGRPRKYALFLFDPLGHPDCASRERLKKKLAMKSIERFFRITLSISPHVIQTLERDGGESLVSCGPLAVEFIRDMMNNPESIDYLDPHLQANSEFGFARLSSAYVMKADVSREMYINKIMEFRALHVALSNKRSNSDFAKMGNLFDPITEEIMDLSQYLQQDYLKSVSQPADEDRFASLLQTEMNKIKMNDPGSDFEQQIRSVMGRPPIPPYEPRIFQPGGDACVPGEENYRFSLK